MFATHLQLLQLLVLVAHAHGVEGEEEGEAGLQGRPTRPLRAVHERKRRTQHIWLPACTPLYQESMCKQRIYWGFQRTHSSGLLVALVSLALQECKHHHLDDGQGLVVDGVLQGAGLPPLGQAHLSRWKMVLLSVGCASGCRAHLGVSWSLLMFQLEAKLQNFCC